MGVDQGNSSGRGTKSGVQGGSLPPLPCPAEREVHAIVETSIKTIDCHVAPNDKRPSGEDPVADKAPLPYRMSALRVGVFTFYMEWGDSK